MNAKLRDPRFSTPESLAAADEFNAASEAMTELTERVRKGGLQAITAAELEAVTNRLKASIMSLPIPRELLKFNPDDWPGREEANFTGNGVHRHAQWNEARQNWCIAHGIWSAFFEDLTAGKFADQLVSSVIDSAQKGLTGRARTRRTSK